jgi:hypothetical protein
MIRTRIQTADPRDPDYLKEPLVPGCDWCIRSSHVRLVAGVGMRRYCAAHDPRRGAPTPRSADVERWNARLRGEI